MPLTDEHEQHDWSQSVPQMVITATGTHELDVCPCGDVRILYVGSWPPAAVTT